MADPTGPAEDNSHDDGSADWEYPSEWLTRKCYGCGEVITFGFPESAFIDVNFENGTQHYWHGLCLARDHIKTHGSGYEVARQNPITMKPREWVGDADAIRGMHL